MTIYDRPSLRMRQGIGRISRRDIVKKLRGKWCKPLRKGKPYVRVTRVLLADGREVWVDDDPVLERRDEPR